MMRSLPAVLAACLLLPACGSESTSGPSDDPSTPPSGNSGGVATIAGCAVFPADNPWNRDVSRDPVDPRSDAYIASIGASRFLHADFGSDPSYGIPWITVPGNQARVPIAFDYDDESDPGPYPIPRDAPIEGGGDRHILLLDRDNCRLYETFDTHYVGPGWRAGSGAIFDLRSNALRPDGWTSADAAGLPILPGLVRRDEVKSGVIRHALRFTTRRTQRGYIAPATHFASSDGDPNLPPMGLRLRMKASYDLSRFRGDALVVLTAMKKHGLLLADNGSDWFISGETNGAWDDSDLDQLKSVPGSAFEVVQSGPIRN
jgi:hypothetical protein